MVEGCVLGPEAPLLDTHEARARRVRDAVSSAAHLARMLAGLDITRARLACDIALLGGSVTRAELHGIASRSGLDRPAIDAAVRTLERHFLLVPLSGGAHHASLVTHTPRRPPDGWRIPAEILAAMDLALTADPIGKQDSTAASASTTMHGGDATAPERSPTIQRAPLQQLCTTLALLVHSPGPMHPASAGAASGGAPARPSASSASELPPELDAPPRATVAAWARMAQVPAGMARLARKVLRTLLERDGAGTALFALDRIPREEWPVALRAGFRAWLDTPSYDELSELGQDRYGVLVRCNPSQLSFQPGALADENTAARHFLIQLLARAPAGDWLPLEEMINLVWRLDPLFLRRRQRAFDTPAWWLEDARTRQPLRPDLRDEWLRGDARYCWALLSGPLHWWGVVDLATDLEGRRALRVTPLGAYLLGASDTPPDLSRSLVSAWGPAVLPAGDGAVAVQPLAAGGGLLDALAAWAHVAGVSGGRLTVRLSTDLACASFDADRDPETLLDQLRACDQRDGTHSTGALAPVLATWRGRYGQTRITHGPVVVEARDEATLAEALATAPELARRCRLVAPEVALVPVEDAPELERALARRGFVT